MTSGDHRATKPRQGPNWQNPQLFSISGGIETGQFERFTWVTTRRGSQVTVPALRGDHGNTMVGDRMINTGNLPLKWIQMKVREYLNR